MRQMRDRWLDHYAELLELARGPRNEAQCDHVLQRWRALKQDRRWVEPGPRLTELESLSGLADRIVHGTPAQIRRRIAELQLLLFPNGQAPLQPLTEPEAPVLPAG